MGRYVLSAIDTPSPGLATAGLDAGKIAVTDDHTGVAPELVAMLSAAGYEAELVEIVPSSGVSGVVFLGGLRSLESIDEAIAVNREAFEAARTMAALNGSNRLFVTVTDLGGTFGLDGKSSDRAWSAGVAGLAKTASIEWPDTTVRSIDIERAERDSTALARAIVTELLQGGPDLEVGLAADGGRITLDSTPIDVEGGQMPIGPGDVIVVSGGARGVTAATTIELARETGATFALLGRSALADEPEFAAGCADDAALKQAMLDDARNHGTEISPKELSSAVAAILAQREIRATVAAIESAGAKALYLSVDITSEAAVSDAFDSIRAAHGPITGIIHGAGVLADKLIAEKTNDQFNSVFNTKVTGLRVLLAATEDDPIKLLCLFSSVAARTGNNGQSDYAMANEILNKVAITESHRRGATCVIKALGWGPWDGGMVSPALRNHFESIGVSLIPLAEGARMLVKEIASPQTHQIELVLGAGVRPVDASA